MKNLKNKVKNMKGITLISLVITIIVLIILVGVTLNILLGENGIINRTKTAKEENDKATATETMNLKITNVQIGKYAEEQRMPTLKELADNFCEDDDFQYVQETSEVASLTKISNENPTSIYTKLKAYPYEFEINSSLQLSSIDGVKVATVPENDDDTIVSMTKAELDNYINTAIENAIKNVSPSNSELQQTLDNITRQSNNLLSTDAYGQNNEFSLSESIKNYKYLLIYCGSYTSHAVSDTMLIETSQIFLSDSEQFDMSMYADPSIYWRIAFSFTSENKIKILWSGNSTWETPRIYRIVGLNYIGE